MATTDFENPLDGFVPEAEFARDTKITSRTVKRYRAEPNGLPWLEWGGRIYIPLKQGHEYILRRVQHPNPKRAA